MKLVPMCQKESFPLPSACWLPSYISKPPQQSPAPPPPPRLLTLLIYNLASLTIFSLSSVSCWSPLLSQIALAMFCLLPSFRTLPDASGSSPSCSYNKNPSFFTRWSGHVGSFFPDVCAAVETSFQQTAQELKRRHGVGESSLS